LHSDCEFDDTGFKLIGDLISVERCKELQAIVSALATTGAGSRNFLPFSWCTELAEYLRRSDAIAQVLPPDAVPVQCNFFEKSGKQNWLVALHQDLSIPVKEKVAHVSLKRWSEKDGAIFVQPPDQILEQLVAVRLHIDNCGPADGPLRVVPGSHRLGRLTNDQALFERNRIGEISCLVKMGGVLMMKPLLLHASSKATNPGGRRVLHFVFGPPALPYGLQWNVSG
jgi:hypothetical protein